MNNVIRLARIFTVAACVFTGIYASCTSASEAAGAGTGKTLPGAEYECRFISENSSNSKVDLSPQTQQTKAQDKSFSLTIMHLNDSHAHAGQFPRLFTAVNKIRATGNNTLLVHSGDVFSGTLYFMKYKGQADLYFLNQLNIDAMTLGNHEFDKGPEVLGDFIKRARFPMVSANINVTADPVLRPYFSKNIGNPGEGGRIYPAVIKQYGEEQVGIIGLTTQDTSLLSNPGEHVTFEDPAEKAQEMIDQLTAAGINKIVVLSHLGFPADKQLAEKVKGIDVIVGGHSHTVLEQPEMVVNREPTLIVQAGEYLNHLGVLDVTFSKDGVIKAYNGKLLPLAAFPEDSDAAEKLLKFKKPLEKLENKVVGKTGVFLNGEREDIRQEETNLGNLIADAILMKANEYVKTQIALLNTGDIRNSIPEGEITLGQILTVLPFENPLVVLELTGEEILQALENSVSEAEKGKGKFAQVSGLRFKYDPNQPAGQRVWFVEVKTERGFEPLDLKKSYSVATTGFIAAGRSGYHMFKKAKDEGRITELLIADFEALQSYLEKHRPVRTEVEGRIIKEEKNPDAQGLLSEKPVVEQVTDRSVVVSGKTSADSTVQVLIGTETYMGEADGSGIFHIFIPEQKAGTLISVLTRDKNGRESVPANVIVKDETPPVPPEIEKINDRSGAVIGKAEKYALITVRAGDEVFIGKANKKGRFKIKIPRQKTGTIISVTATDKAGNESVPAEIITGKN